MTARLLACLVLLLGGWTGLAGAQPETRAAPVVVELYTSQGCSQCPRANRLLGQIVAEPNVIALTFAVNYWDYLGWRDSFAQPDFTDRQRAYARALRARGLVTPQLVFNGERQSRATDWDAALALLRQVQSEPPRANTPTLAMERLANGGVALSITGGQLPDAEAADVWVMGVDPGPVTIWAQRGENAQRRITHYNLVRSIDRAGFWRGEPIRLDQRICRPDCVALVQMHDGGPILAAAYVRRTR